ncbi:MAG: hypothetical protein LBR70_02210 [Lactobacillaceae bacterium]|jgi:hypothetical protein|nr:hypothetical protein [Lactobacillaceae bacterium]
MKKSFLEKMFEIDAYINQKYMQRKEEKKPFRMPFGRLIFSPFSYLIDYFKNIAVLMGAYSAVITVFSLLAGLTFMCIFPEAVAAGMYCSSSLTVYFFYILLKLVIFSGFILSYYNIVSGKEFSFRSIFNIGLHNLKVLGGFFVFILLNLVPFFSMYALIKRVPNPNWIIESVFFGCMFIGFIVPFIVLRFYGVFGYFIETGKVYSLRTILRLTRGNGLRLLLSLFFIVLFSVLFIANYFANFRVIFDSSSIWISAAASEFVYNIIILIAIGLMVGNMRVQRSILITDEEDTAEDDKK